MILYSWLWILQDVGWYTTYNTTILNIVQDPSWWNSNNSNNTNCLPYWFSVSWLLTLQTDCVRRPGPAPLHSKSSLQILRKYLGQIWWCQFVRWAGGGILTGTLLDIQIWIWNPFCVLYEYSVWLSILLQKSIKNNAWINVEPRKWLMWLTLVSAGEWKNIPDIWSSWSVQFFLFHEVKLTDGDIQLRNSIMI